MTERKSEMVSIGHETAGRFCETNRGFELFDESDQYLAIAESIKEARRFLYEHHRDRHLKVRP